MKTYVTLSAGFSVSLGDYVAGWKQVKSDDPNRMYNRGLSTWWATSARDILSQYREAMHDRINRRKPDHYRIITGQ